MAHFMRVFTKNTAAPTISALCKQLETDEFTFDTFPKQDDPRYTLENWRTLHLAYDKNVASVMLDRSVRGDEGDVFGEEIEEFQELLQAAEGAGKQAVAEILQNASQIFACYIPDDLTEEGWELVESLLEKLLDATEGTLQVDGEGFFDKEGELLLALE